VFVADTNNGRVVELPAGSTQQHDLLDGLNNPAAVAADAGGDLFVADTNDNQIFEVPAGSTSGTELPFDGLQYPQGVAVDGDGDVYVSDSDNNQVVELPAGQSSTQQTVLTGLSDPQRLTLDSAGDLFVAGGNDGQVDELPAGASSATALPFTGLTYPTGVAVDQAGDVYTSDFSHSRVLELPVETTPAVTGVSPSSGPVSGGTPITLTGSGFAAGDTVLIGQGDGAASGALAAKHVDVVDDSTITATTRGHATAGLFYVFVVSPTGAVSAPADSAAFSYVRPAVTKVKPSSGPVTGGTTITVVGSGFVTGDHVEIAQGKQSSGPLRAKHVQVVSATRITAVTRGGARAGTHHLFVVPPSGSTSSPTRADLFTYQKK
jgi:hypothetical protein